MGESQYKWGVYLNKYPKSLKSIGLGVYFFGDEKYLYFSFLRYELCLGKTTKI